MTHHDARHDPMRTPAPLRPCDVFSEDIHLLVDRELGEAERQIVEEHLAGCARCLGLATHLERMSSVLKAWDVRENDIPAPDVRLQRSVLARVAESSAQRRRDDRFVRVLHLATAAVVVLGLGLGVVLGFAHTGARGPDPVFEVSDAPWPLENRERPQANLPTTPFEDRITATDLLTGLTDVSHPELQDDPGVIGDDHMRVFASGDDESMVALDMRVTRLEQFMDRFGERAMYWNGPYATGAMPRVVSERTYRWLESEGILARWRDNGTPTSRTVVGGASRPGQERPSETSPATTLRATGVMAKDMLRPMPGVTSPLRLGSQRTLLTMPGVHPMRSARTKSGKPRSTRGLPNLLELRAITDPVGNIPGLRSGPLNLQNRAFLDPLAAAANGQLRFVESENQAGRIVAIVRNTEQPVFIPAGQFITGGYGDRVVRHPVWLPAATSDTPHIIECFLVQAMPTFERQGDPRLSQHVAGPTIRALLASGATQSEVKAAAAALCRAQHELYGAAFQELRWSLRSIYMQGLTASPGKGGLDALGRIRWSGTHGFLATDDQGRFLGFELVRIDGASAQALLARLARGYTIEAFWRIQSSALRDAFAAPSDGAERVLRRLASHPAGFRIPEGVTDTGGSANGTDPRVSTLDLQASGVQLHALEVGGRAAVVSGLSQPASK